MSDATVIRTEKVTTKMTATIGSRKYKRKSVTVTTTEVPDVSVWETIKEGIQSWRNGRPTCKIGQWLGSPKK